MTVKQEIHRNSPISQAERQFFSAFLIYVYFFVRLLRIEPHQSDSPVEEALWGMNVKTPTMYRTRLTRIYRDHAQELLDCWWIKPNEIIHVNDREHATFRGGYPNGWNLVVEGMTPEGPLLSAKRQLGSEAPDVLKNFPHNIPPLTV